MANPRKEGKIRKLKQNVKKYSKTNPALAEKISNKLSVLEKTK